MSQRHGQVNKRAPLQTQVKSTMELRSIAPQSATTSAAVGGLGFASAALSTTNADSFESYALGSNAGQLSPPPPPTPPIAAAATPLQHRRRGSSKSGLAYLVSRRNSRESMKSVASNASIFSNEDVGPLAFQASVRGRQRRTSNFLELPRKYIM